MRGVLFCCVSPSLHLSGPTCSVLGPTGPFVLETNSVWSWLSARCSRLHEAFVHDGSGANQAEGGGEEFSLPLERYPWLFGGLLQVERCVEASSSAPCPW